MSAASKTAALLVEMERAALERWGRGDPGGFLEISASDVVYFDPYVDKRIDGIAALRARYRTLWGKVRVDRFEMIDPKVQRDGSSAVLTFNLVSHVGDRAIRWNCTEVFRNRGPGWRILQSHWSYTAHPAIVAAPGE